MKSTTFHGVECLVLDNESLSLLIARSVGPRILALHWHGGPNLLAEVPDATLEGAARGAYHLRGGHRLWHAPEVPARTYVPDDEPLDVEALASGLVVRAPVEPETGLAKRLHIRLEGARVVLEHTLINCGLWPVECAPWAITQLRPGGTAILPQAIQAADPHGVLPNRSLILWPYTRLDSEALRIGNRYVWVTAPAGEEKLKIGLPNPRGWLAYHVAETLFVKTAPFDPLARYFDRGASSQCYADARFVELETLAPRTWLAPGASATHEERWEVRGAAGFDGSEAATERLVAQAALDDPSEESS